MAISTAITAILVALLVGAMSPGPSFVVVARTAVGSSRQAGLAAALGMGVGGVLFSGVALIGLYTVLATVGWLYIGLKIAGGLYLVYLACKMWRGAKEPLALHDLPGGQGTRKAFLTALATQLSNPKTAIAYGSIFASLLPHNPPLWCYFALPPLVFLVEAGWYSTVALCLSSRRPRELYLRSKAGIDRVAAGAIGGLGLRLIWTARVTD